VWDLQTDRLIRYLPGSAFAQFNHRYLSTGSILASLQRPRFQRRTPPRHSVHEALFLTIIWAGVASHPLISDAANRLLHEWVIVHPSPGQRCLDGHRRDLAA